MRGERCRETDVVTGKALDQKCKLMARRPERHGFAEGFFQELPHSIPVHTPLLGEPSTTTGLYAVDAMPELRLSPSSQSIDLTLNNWAYNFGSFKETRPIPTSGYRNT